VIEQQVNNTGKDFYNHDLKVNEVSVDEELKDLIATITKPCSKQN